MKGIKLSIYAVLGEGQKLMFDIPASMQQLVGVKELLQCLQGKHGSKETISASYRANLYDAIHNPNRTVSDPKR